MIKELDFVKAMFDRIAPRYDFLNRLLSLHQDTLWRTRMVAAATLEKNSAVLDVACGTCDVAMEVNTALNGQARIVGLDFSMGMLHLGQKKLKKATLENICLVNGDALALPFSSGQFDAVFIAFGIRNIMNRQQAVTAFFDVLKPGGRLVVLELTTPEKKWLKWLYLLYFQKILPRIGSFLSTDKNAYTYLPESVLKFPSAAEFANVMCRAGLTSIRYQQMSLGIVTLFIGTRPGLSAS